MSDCKWSYRW